MRSCLSCLRTRDCEFLFDDDARVAAVVVVIVIRARRTRNHHIHRYGVRPMAAVHHHLLFP